jgi:hypothetical protein
LPVALLVVPVAVPVVPAAGRPVAPDPIAQSVLTSEVVVPAAVLPPIVVVLAQLPVRAAPAVIRPCPVGSPELSDPVVELERLDVDPVPGRLLLGSVEALDPSVPSDFTLPFVDDPTTPGFEFMLPLVVEPAMPVALLPVVPAPAPVVPCAYAAPAKTMLTAVTRPRTVFFMTPSCDSSNRSDPGARRAFTCWREPVGGWS